MNREDSLFQVLTQQEPFQQESRPEMAAIRLRDIILSGKLPSGARLPNELELAKMMGVSRGTLRSALSILEQKGLIWRRQGMGSFVSERPILENRLDINTGVTDLIESMGLSPGSILNEIKLIHADEEQANQLNVPLETPLVSIRRIRTASGQPVVASIDLFPYEIIQREPNPLDLDGLKNALEKWHSLYRVLEHEVSIVIEFGIAKVRPVEVDAQLMKQIGLKLPPGSVMLFLEQLDFDHERQPKILSYEYHVSDFCTFTIYRKR